jgi:predicted RNase H-related nuclease YkuK (DUF458 family)
MFNEQEKIRMPKTVAPVKKTAVKPAKKTTFEDVWLAIERTQASIDRVSKETQASIKETQASIDRMSKETQASIKETQASIDRVSKETQASVEKTQVSIGRLGNRLGDIMESIMVPGLISKFGKLGYDFSKMSRNNKIKDFKHDIVMEIDALLENGDCAMAVEVKVNLSVDDVKEHSARMEKLHKYAALHGDRRAFYAAMAAAMIDEDTKTFALKQGFYVIELSGENITITEPFGKPKVF